VRAAALALAAGLLAAACGGGADAPTTVPVSSSTSTWALATTSTAAPTTTAAATTTSPTVPPDAAPDPAELAAIVLFPKDLPAAYQSLPLDSIGSGFRPAGASLSSALEPADEADDIVRFGLLGDFVTTYGTTTGTWLSVEAVAFSNAAGAGGYLADWQVDLTRGAAQAEAGASDLTAFAASPADTAADEAVRADYTITLRGGGEERETAGAVLVVRSGTTLAWVWAAGESPGEVVDAVGPVVEERLLAVLSGEIPARDPALLGLPLPPTALLDSFAFEYSYGIETVAPGAGFRIEVTGEFQGPDRASCRVAYTGGEDQPVFSYLVVTGTRVWLGDMTGYQEVPLRHPSALSNLPLCPGHPLFWESTSFHRLPERTGEAGTLDGIAVVRYDLAEDPAALEALGYFPEEAGRVTRYQVARAVDGGWLMEVDVEQQADLAEALRSFGFPEEGAHAGIPATLFTHLRLSRPDDPAIEVEPPLLAG
jgi:hypothetical protein